MQDAYLLAELREDAKAFLHQMVASGASRHVVASSSNTLLLTIHNQRCKLLGTDSPIEQFGTIDNEVLPRLAAQVPTLRAQVGQFLLGNECNSSCGFGAA